MQQHHRVTWVQYVKLTQGFAVRCTVCGDQTTTGALNGVEAFAQNHQEHRSAAPGHYGVGDLVASATKAMGIAPCTPCEARRRQLNGLFPRAWRR